MKSSNFLKEHIDSIDTEISWSSGYKLKEEFNKQNIQFFRQNIVLSNGSELEVCFDSLEYIELLEEKFNFIDEKTKNSLGTLYFCSSNKVSDEGNVIMEEKTVYVIGDGFGILKSAINGLATLMLGEKEPVLPIHGSAIVSKDIGGLSFVGGHRVGKTTGLLNISDILGSGEIVSDDWLLAKFANGELNVTSTDNSISLSSKSVLENPHITRINSTEIMNTLMKRKKSYKPECLLGSGFYPHTKEVKIDNIVLLVKGFKDAITRLTDLKEVPEFILGSTYHFPYISEELKNTHIETWRRGLNNSDTNVLVYDYTHFDSMVEGYKKLIDFIIKGKI